ncbi:MAG: magnesium transporter [Solirubrobacterales bacterium]|nr:magnesium transporter [Solirubrobacterales bacterium]MBV9914880.1 magnesium transporter [Solirubrobacterales bacterium]
MAERIVYVSRLKRLPLISSDGADVGHVVDVVMELGGKPPRVNGFVVAVPRRRVFIGIGRVGEIESGGVRLRRASVNLRQFELRQGERLLDGELLGRRVRGARVVDIGITPAPEPFAWEVATVALAGRRVPGRLRRAPEIIDWSEAGELFANDRSVDREVATLGGLHPAEMAAAIRRLPLSRRRLLAAALEDDRLADLLEELSEDEQVRLVEELSPDRLADVLEEMDADDAADLLGEFSASRRAELLGAMDPEEAEPVRRLLSYDPATAGGLMTPEPIILDPQSTIAEALARVRDPDMPVPLAAQVFVCQPPLETPTGRYLGMVSFQRLLREAPSKPIGRCIEEDVVPMPADASDREVAGRLAAYDVVALPVVDDHGRLLGAVTIDDVLDRVLPANWRAALAAS